VNEYKPLPPRPQLSHAQAGRPPEILRQDRGRPDENNRHSRQRDIAADAPSDLLVERQLIQEVDCPLVAMRRVLPEVPLSSTSVAVTASVPAASVVVSRCTILHMRKQSGFRV